MKVKNYLIKLFIVLLVLFVAMSFSIYVYDPLLYYRIPEDRLIINNYRFINPGLAMNADYDTVIIGSSMIQNFDMDQFRNELDLNPIKLSVGGMSIEGMKLTYDLVFREGKANNVFIAIDIPALSYSFKDLKTYSTYLYDDNKLNDIRYLLGYETWLRLLPLSIGYNVLDRLNYKVPNYYATYSVDDIAYWADTATFDEELVKEIYLSNVSLSSEILDEGLESRLSNNADNFLEIFDDFSLKKYTFFFPPYSALFWHIVDSSGQMDSYLAIKSYLVQKLSFYNNVEIYDFQDINEIINLNLYKDYTHYSPDINSLMVESFKKKKYKVIDFNNYNNDNLLSVLSNFREINSYWLK